MWGGSTDGQKPGMLANTLHSMGKLRMPKQRKSGWYSLDLEYSLEVNVPKTSSPARGSAGGMGVLGTFGG